uniref:NAD(P)-binding protein n=1 Tax=Parastrongyloides trichosuri TaxID=131310 RepID=A0A0N5A3G7_PARTI
MSSKVLNILITGGNQGIGFETAKHLARRGYNITIACRNMNAANEAVETITKETDGNNQINCVELDLCSFESVKKCSEKLISSGKNFDVVILNAGTMHPKEPFTQDGLETTLQVNFLSHYLLLELLRKNDIGLAKPARIICLTSILHRWCDSLFSLPKSSSEWLSFMKNEKILQNSQNIAYSSIKLSTFEKLKYYAISKAANAMLAHHLNSIENVYAISVHPGIVRTSMTKNFSNRSPKFLSFIKRCFITPQEASFHVSAALDKTFAIDYITNNDVYQHCETTAGLKKYVRSGENFAKMKEAADKIIASYI